MRFVTLILALWVTACGQLSARDADSLILPDGSRYTGPLEDGLMSGKGRLEWLNGDVYLGEFAAGVIQGQGELTLKSGEVYRGHFEQGVLNGKGQWQGSDGISYTGEFKDDAFHGEGIYASPEGAYTGEFVEGQLTGLGTYTGEDGNRYAGEFEAWQFSGAGIWEDEQNRYTGEFKAGLFHGYGERVDVATGEVLEAGKWRWGRFIGESLSAEERRAQKLAIEQALFDQNARFENAFAALEASQPGEVDLFVLLGAGDGTQKVFALETQTIAQTLERSFAKPGHVAVLSNHPSTMANLPLFTLGNMQKALSRLSENMQSEDILLLYLTSHGSAEHALSLEAPEHDFIDLTAAELMQYLEPLQNNPKIIMLSACYSGGFVEPLQAPNHLVMTAARADRTSFGCGDSDTMTYFGRAYFEQALPEAEGFIQAFEQAKALIERWEDEDEFEHSEPQVFVGDSVEKVLEMYWRNLVDR